MQRYLKVVQGWCTGAGGTTGALQGCRPFQNIAAATIMIVTTDQQAVGPLQDARTLLRPA